MAPPHYSVRNSLIPLQHEQNDSIRAITITITTTTLWPALFQQCSAPISILFLHPFHPLLNHTCAVNDTGKGGDTTKSQNTNPEFVSFLPSGCVFFQRITEGSSMACAIASRSLPFLWLRTTLYRRRLCPS